MFTCAALVQGEETSTEKRQTVCLSSLILSSEVGIHSFPNNFFLRASHSIVSGDMEVNEDNKKPLKLLVGQ
jgi:hypothetical protein